MLDAFKKRRNNLLKSFSSEFAFYFWTARRKVSDYPEGHFTHDFAKAVNEKYQQRMKAKTLYRNTLYLAVITKQPEGMLNKGLNFLQLLNHAVDKTAKQQYLIKRHQELNEVTRKIIGMLADYQPNVLTVYEKNGVLLSAPLQFLSGIVNIDDCPVPLQIADASTSLLSQRLFFNRKAGVIEWRAADGHKKFAAVLSLKEYAPFTHQGLLDELHPIVSFL
jgi:type IV secretion system protein VirB4